MRLAHTNFLNRCKYPRISVSIETKGKSTKSKGGDNISLALALNPLRGPVIPQRILSKEYLREGRSAVDSILCFELSWDILLMCLEYNSKLIREFREKGYFACRNTPISVS